jgi:hypothetical protein
MDYGQACRQTFIYRITEGLPVIHPKHSGWFAARRCLAYGADGDFDQ